MSICVMGLQQGPWKRSRASALGWLRSADKIVILLKSKIRECH